MGWGNSIGLAKNAMTKAMPCSSTLITSTIKKPKAWLCASGKEFLSMVNTKMKPMRCARTEMPTATESSTAPFFAFSPLPSLEKATIPPIKPKMACSTSPIPEHRLANAMVPSAEAISLAERVDGAPPPGEELLIPLAAAAQLPWQPAQAVWQAPMPRQTTLPIMAKIRIATLMGGLRYKSGFWKRCADCECYLQYVD